MKKTMKQNSFTARLKSLVVVFGIGLAFASCANEDVAQNPTNSNEDNDKNLTPLLQVTRQRLAHQWITPVETFIGKQAIIST